MSTCAIKTLTAFDYQADFSSTSVPKPDTVTLSASELSAMLAEAHSAGAQSVQTDALKDQTATIQNIAQDLTAAMAELTGLARHLETLGLSHPQIASVRHRIESACTRILDGQRDLFEAADDQ